MMQRTLGILMALLLALTSLFLPTGRSEAAGLQDGDFSCRGVALGASEQELFRPVASRSSTRRSACRA